VNNAMMKTVAATVLLTLLSVAAAETLQAPALPSAAEALAAYKEFNAAPVAGLRAAQTFVDFIRGTGEIHIVLNENLLSWMYKDFDPQSKAVLYAAFLGGNMRAQLEDGESSNGDVAGMLSAVAAYRALQAQNANFSLPFFERLLSAETNGDLTLKLNQLMAGADND